jgi:hypothetical protein
MIILAAASQHQLHSKMTSIKSLCSLTLDLPPSCIEFWPSDSEYAIVGTYNLEKQTEQEQPDAAQDGEQKKSQSRNGSLILVHVDGDNVYVTMLDVVVGFANHRSVVKSARPSRHLLRFWTFTSFQSTWQTRSLEYQRLLDRSPYISLQSQGGSIPSYHTCKLSSTSLRTSSSPLSHGTLNNRQSA